MHFSAELSKTLRHWCRSAPTQKCEKLRHQTHSAEMSGPKCLRSEVSVHLTSAVFRPSKEMDWFVAWSIGV